MCIFHHHSVKIFVLCRVLGAVQCERIVAICTIVWSGYQFWFFFLFGHGLQVLKLFLERTFVDSRNKVLKANEHSHIKYKRTSNGNEKGKIPLAMNVSRTATSTPTMADIFWISDLKYQTIAIIQPMAHEIAIRYNENEQMDDSYAKIAMCVVFSSCVWPTIGVV